MKSGDNGWVKGFAGSITVCDANGIILEMNDRSVAMFAKDGGRELIGRSVLDCHPEPSRQKLQRMMEQRATNVYTIEKNGVKKLIHQSPWFVDGQYAGFVELALEIPVEMPHFVRS